MTDVSSNIPNHLMSTFILLKRAFSEGIFAKDYFPLLSVMQDTGMSNRIVAYALHYYDNGNYYSYLYEVSHILPNTKIAEECKEIIREKLRPYCFDEWKDEE